MHRRKAGERLEGRTAGAEKKNAPLVETQCNWERKILGVPLHSKLAAIREAGELRDARAMPAIYGLIRDFNCDASVFDVAEEAIDKIGQGALEYLMGRLEQGDRIPFPIVLIIEEMAYSHKESLVGATPAIIRAFESLIDKSVAGDVRPIVGVLAEMLGEIKDTRAIKPLETALVLLLASSKRLSEQDSEPTCSDGDLYSDVEGIKEALLKLGVSEERVKLLVAQADTNANVIGRGRIFWDMINEGVPECEHDDKTGSVN